MSLERSTSSSASTSNNHNHSSWSPNSAFQRLCKALSSKGSTNNVETSNSKLTDSMQTRYNWEDDIVERVFNYFDEDEDGRISPKELHSCMQMVGGGATELSLLEAEMVVESSDSDGDGLLGLEDFMKLIGGRNEAEEEEEEEELTAAFGMYAAEGSGCITAKSLKRMLSRLGQSNSVGDCREMIRKFDVNGDGMLNFEEFRMMMAR